MKLPIVPDSERLLLFDADGCFFNRSYLDSAEKCPIFHNRPLLNAIQTENQMFEKVEIGCSSLRQTEGQNAEASRRNHTGSCFIALRDIASYLNIPISPLLLPDVYNNLAEGVSLRRILDMNSREPHAADLPDESKLTIFYGFIHWKKSKTPRVLYVDAFDDLRPLLEGLSNFFSKYPEMLPKDVHLRLFHYAGGEATLIAEIVGTGSVDLKYRQTIIHMADLSVPNKNGYRQCIHHVTPELLRQKASSTSNSRGTMIPWYLHEALGRRTFWENAQSKGLYDLNSISVEELHNKLHDVINIHSNEHNKYYDVEMLLRYKPEVITYLNSKGYSLLHYVATRGHLDLMCLFTRTAGIDLNKLTSEVEDVTYHPGLTALDLAILWGQDQIAIRLIHSRAQSFPMLFGQPILHYAASQNMLHTFKALSPFYLNEQLTLIGGVTPLHIVCAYGYFELAEYILKRDRNLINVCSELEVNEPYSAMANKYPLACAIEGEHEDLAMYLLEKNSIIPPPIPGELHIIHIAAKKGQYIQVKRLINENKDLLNLVDHLNQTALYHAAAAGRVPVVKLLINLGADAHIARQLPQGLENATQSPLDIARENGHVAVVRMLLAVETRVEDEVTVEPTPSSAPFHWMMMFRPATLSEASPTTQCCSIM